MDDLFIFSKILNSNLIDEKLLQPIIFVNEKFQEYHHNPVVFELQILVKRLLLCNGRNQHIPLKT